MRQIASRIDHLIAQQLGRPSGRLGALAMGPILAYGNRALNAWLHTILPIRADDRVLDLGCGPGAALGRVARQLPDGLAIGLDYAAPMVRQAQRHNQALIRRGRAGMLQGAAQHLPFRDSAFTVVYAVNVIYFWPAAGQVLSEVRRVLQPDGIVALVTRLPERVQQLGFMRYGLRLYQEPELVALLQAAGFHSPRTTTSASSGRLGGLCALARR